MGKRGVWYSRHLRRSCIFFCNSFARMAIVACRGPLQTSQSAVVAFSPPLLLLLLLLLLARFAPLLSPFFPAPFPPSQNLLVASISRDIQLLSFPLVLSYFLWTLVAVFVCCCYSSSELFFRFLFSLLLVCLIVSGCFSTPGWWSSAAAAAVCDTQVFLCWVFSVSFFDPFFFGGGFFVTSSWRIRKGKKSIESLVN